MISKVRLVVFRWFGCLRRSFVEEGGPWWGACAPRATAGDGVFRRRFSVMIFCCWVVLCFSDSLLCAYINLVIGCGPECVTNSLFM